MKLAVITPRYAAGGVVGGAETLLRELARYAVAAGHEVHLLTTCALDPHTWRNEREPGTETHEGMQIHFFRVNDDRNVERFHTLQARIDKSQTLTRDEERAWADNSVNSRDLTAWLQHQGTGMDRILAGPYLFGVILAATAVHPDKTWLVPCLHDEPFARLACVRDMFLRVKGILFNADPERQLARRLFGLPDDAGTVVGMGINPFDAAPDAFARRHGLTRPYVLYCGRREGGKNTPLLLDYLDTYIKRRQSDLLVVLTGAGDIHPPETLRPAILDLGFVTESEKHEAMAGARVFIQPSTNESFGIVLLEAWMARTPAIVHARSEVLRWQCEEANAGLWFSYYPEFEAMLDALLENETLRNTLGENGRTRVLNHYSRDAVQQRFLAALEETP